MRQSTDTTEFDYLGRETGELHDGHRFAVRRQPEQVGEDFRHGVAADIGVLEHEGVARMIAEGLNPPDQLVVDHARGAVLQFAHALIEQVDEILDAVGHRRIGGEAGVARIALLGQRAFVVDAVLQISRLGQRNNFRQDFDFLVDAGAAAEKGVDRFLEIEQPERQPQVSWGEHLRLVAEAAAIFVVRIDQEDAQVRARVEDLLQNDGDAARLADAGGADDGEMPAHQLVDVDVHADFGVLLQVADMRMVGVGRAIDQPQLALGEQQRAVADVRIFHDAALELRRAAFAGTNLADQIEARDFAIGRSAARRHHGLLADIGDQPDGQHFAGHHAHEFSDRRMFAAVAARGEFDGGLRTRDRRDAADQIRPWPSRRMAMNCMMRG